MCGHVFVAKQSRWELRKK